MSLNLNSNPDLHFLFHYTSIAPISLSMIIKMKFKLKILLGYLQSIGNDNVGPNVPQTNGSRFDLDASKSEMVNQYYSSDYDSGRRKTPSFVSTK